MSEDPASPRAIALAFIERFCAGDVEGLRPLLDPALSFAGPLLTSETREAYLDALRADPPAPAAFRVRRIAAEGNAVAIFYDYTRAERTLLIAQFATLRSGRITELLLVFDGRTL